MSSETILSLIDAEIARLTQVRSILASAGSVSEKLIVSKIARVGRPAKTAKAVKAIKATKAVRKKRVLSAEARKRIADAQRKRWAAQKSKAKA